MDQSVATYLEGMGALLEIPHTMFVLRGPRTVVVDTSFGSAAVIREHYPQEVWRDAAEEPSAMLAELGVNADDVEIVVCTHLHYDHCGGNYLFPNARILVQQAELDYSLHPISSLMEREYFSIDAGYPPQCDVRNLVPISGDVEVAAGLRLVALPGHTPGSQGLVVDTAHGRLALAGDLIMVRENFDDAIPVGLHTDLDAWYRSHRRLRDLTDHVVPSHDLRVFASDDPIVEVSA
jgi:N-acyl homoserine lactone hydrolase